MHVFWTICFLLILWEMSIFTADDFRGSRGRDKQARGISLGAARAPGEQASVSIPFAGQRSCLRSRGSSGCESHQRVGGACGVVPLGQMYRPMKTKAGANPNAQQPKR